MSSESESDVDYLPVPKAADSRLQCVQHIHNQPASRTDLLVPKAAARQLQCVQHNQPASVTDTRRLKMFAVREARSSKFRATMKRNFGKSLNSVVTLISRRFLRKGDSARVLRDRNNNPY